MPIMYGINARVRAAEGHVLKDTTFFVLAYDSSTEGGAHGLSCVVVDYRCHPELTSQ